MAQDDTGMQVGLSPGDFVLDGDPAPLPKRSGAPQFSAHVYCGQTAAWIKMPLGTEVGLGPGHIVLDGDLALPSRKGVQQPPLFGPSLRWPNGLSSQQLLSSCLWSPYVIGRPYIFSCCGLFFFFLLLLFFPRLISAAGDWMFTILWHMVWP